MLRQSPPQASVHAFGGGTGSPQYLQDVRNEDATGSAEAVDHCRICCVTVCANLEELNRHRLQEVRALTASGQPQCFGWCINGINVRRADISSDIMLSLRSFGKSEIIRQVRQQVILHQSADARPPMQLELAANPLCCCVCVTASEDQMLWRRTRCTWR